MILARQLFVATLLGILAGSYNLTIDGVLFWLIIIVGNIVFGLLNGGQEDV